MVISAPNGIRPLEPIGFLELGTSRTVATKPMTRDGHVDEEHRAPPVSTTGGSHRGSDRWPPPSPAVPDQIPMALARSRRLGEDVGQDRQRARHECRRPHAHDRSRRGQPVRRGRQGGEGRPRTEDHQPGQEHPLAPEPVAWRPEGEQQAGEHDGVGVDDPLELARRGVEVRTIEGSATLKMVVSRLMISNVTHSTERVAHRHAPCVLTPVLRPRPWRSPCCTRTSMRRAGPANRGDGPSEPVVQAGRSREATSAAASAAASTTRSKTGSSWARAGEEHLVGPRGQGHAAAQHGVEEAGVDAVAGQGPGRDVVGRRRDRAVGSRRQEQADQRPHGRHRRPPGRRPRWPTRAPWRRRRPGLPARRSRPARPRRARPGRPPWPAGSPTGCPPGTPGPRRGQRRHQVAPAAEGAHRQTRRRSPCRSTTGRASPPTTRWRRRGPGGSR